VNTAEVDQSCPDCGKDTLVITVRLVDPQEPLRPVMSCTSCPFILTGRFDGRHATFTREDSETP
jgi:hypothetical protein